MANPQTTLTTLSLQARDWFLISSFVIGSEQFDNICFELKTKMQIPNPPLGTTLIEITDHPLGNILDLYEILYYRQGKEIGKNALNRFKTTLLALNTQEITDYFTTLDTITTTAENTYQEVGRKWLRGKLG